MSSSRIPYPPDPNTWWSKSLCAPDDYNTIVRCTENFWSPCIIPFLYATLIYHLAVS